MDKVGGELDNVCWNQEAWLRWSDEWERPRSHDSGDIKDLLKAPGDRLSRWLCSLPEWICGQVNNLFFKMFPGAQLGPFEVFTVSNDTTATS